MDIEPVNIDLESTQDQDQSLESHSSSPETRRSGTRNKPTLSCNACVVRKTKCDRTRPTCQSCARRQSACEYSALANIIAVMGSTRSRKRMAKPRPVSSPVEVSMTTPAATSLASPQHSTFSDMLPVFAPTPSPMAATLAEQYRHNDPSKDRPALFNLFGMGAQHPFHNYWTNAGGVSEVISMLPIREVADGLVQRYFEVVNPLYPIIPKDVFMAEYEQFWLTPQEEKHLCDPGHLALQFAIYATGMQYMSHQRSESLCISSYLNQCTLITMQTMILICNYLIANARVSDAWTFSGITHRQAYGLGLNRDPALVRPDAPFWEKQLRCRLWQAIMFQDTSLSLYLELPPATIHYEIHPSSFKFTDDLVDDVWTLTSPQGLPDTTTSVTDTKYLSAMWHFTQFVQEHICVNKSLKRPITTDPANKAQLIARFRDIYAAFEPPFNSYDSSRFENKPPRLVRQLISVSSNYFFALGILYMDQNDNTGVSWDAYGALDAAHEALSAFFALARLFPDQIDMWGPVQTRAYRQATMTGLVLAAQPRPAQDYRDHRLMLAKSNFDRYLDLLARTQGSADFNLLSQTRMAELQGLRDKITVV